MSDNTMKGVAIISLLGASGAGIWAHNFGAVLCIFAVMLTVISESIEWRDAFISRTAEAAKTPASGKEGKL